MIQAGNISQKIASHPETRGWFFGHFMPEGDIFHSHDVELKYHAYKKGEKHIGSRTSNTRKTLVLLISGQVRIAFPLSQREYILCNPFDYVIDDEIPGDHEFEALEDSIILGIRTPSQPR